MTATTESLQPLFDIVCKIASETEIDLKFSVMRITRERALIDWYIGLATSPEHGSNTDYLRTDDLDEDKCIVWTEQLTYLYREALGLCDDEIQVDEDAQKYDEWEAAGKCESDYDANGWKGK